MTEVIVSQAINIPAVKAWKALSSFRGIENYSPVERSETSGEGAGSTRTCYLPDGAAIHEVLNFVENDKMEMQYKITEGPFPISNYQSDVKVSAIDAERCKITWGCEFDSSAEVQKDMEELFGGFYKVIIESLETYLKN